MARVYVESIFMIFNIHDSVETLESSYVIDWAWLHLYT